MDQLFPTTGVRGYHHQDLTPFQRAFSSLWPQPSLEEVGQFERKFRELIGYYNAPFTLREKAAGEKLTTFELAGMLNREDPLQELLWRFFEEEFKGCAHEFEGNDANVQIFYGVEASASEAYRDLEELYAPHEMFELDKFTIDHLKHAAALKTLYGNFEEEILEVQDIEAVFAEALAVLKSNDGLQGAFRQFFVGKLMRIPRKISPEAYTRLQKLTS